MLKKAAIYFFALFALQASAHSELGLQNVIGDVTSAYGWWCRGDACYGVWREQIRAMDAVSTFVDTQIYNQSIVTPQSGRMAWVASDKICNSNATGNLEWIRSIIVSQNRVLPRLAEIQRLAGIQIRTCTRTSR